MYDEIPMQRTNTEASIASVASVASSTVKRRNQLYGSVADVKKVESPPPKTSSKRGKKYQKQFRCIVQ